VALATIEYWLSVGFTFEVAREIIKTLQEKYPRFLNERQPKRLIFVKESQAGHSKLVKSDWDNVVATWTQGQFVVPIWLDVIYGQLCEKVKR
jgi:hypothetical protein